jgi:hypothetical protein
MSTALSLPPIEALAVAAQELASAAQAAGDGATMRAVNKAAAQLHAGCVPTPTVGGFLIESRTRSGTVHRYSNTFGCSCEAATARQGDPRPCWHAQLIRILETAAQRYTMPALARRPSYADALVAASELWG